MMMMIIIISINLRSQESMKTQIQMFKFEHV